MGLVAPTKLLQAPPDPTEDYLPLETTANERRSLTCKQFLQQYMVGGGQATLERSPLT